MFSIFTSERPQTDQERLDEFTRRLALYHSELLLEQVSELEDLIGLGDPERIPAYLRRQAC